MTDPDQYDSATCCLCGSKKNSRVSSGPIFPLVACSECGLIRQGFSSGLQETAHASYAGGSDRYLQQQKDKQTIQVMDYMKIMRQLEKYIPEKGRILEIGCSMGTFLNEVRNLGWKVVGVEPDVHTCELARSKYGLDVINSMLQEADLNEASFDAVLLLHVIEHLPNPANGLSQIARIIRPGGFLILETPRFDTLWFRLLKGRERSVITGHKYYFTRKTIRALVACYSGFEVVRLDSVGRTVTVDRLCYYAAKFLNSDWLTRVLIFFSKALYLNKMHLHINLHDMMRLYLRKVA